MNLRSIPQNRIVDLDYSESGLKNRRVIIPGFLSEKLAYYIGYLQGDGCIESNMKRICFTDENLQHIDFINQLTYDLFNLSGNIRIRRPPLSKKEVYTLEIGSVDLHRFIREVFTFPVGIKQDLKIPCQIAKNKELLKWYLRGLFDADGTLPKDSFSVKIPFVDITLKDKTLIEAMRDCLRLFGIETLKPYRRLAKSPHSDYISSTWELRIRRKEQIIRFINEIGFFAEHKANRAILLLKRLNAPVAQSGYVCSGAGEREIQ